MLLCDEDLKELTALNEREYQENSDTAVDRPQLTNNALKKGLQIVDDVITSSRLTISRHTCIKFKHKMKNVMAPIQGSV